MCFGKHTKKRNDRVEKGMDSVYGKDNNPIRKIKKKLRCIQTCGIVWLFLAILLIAIGGTLLYFFISYMNTTGDWHIYLTYSGIAAVSLGGLMFILGIITLICFCHLVKKNQKKLSGKPTKQKKGASLQKQYPVGTYPAQKDFGGEDQSKPAGHLPPIDPDEMKKGKDGKKKKKKKKKKVDPELGYEVNADTEAMIKPEHHGGVHSGRMDLLNEGIEEAIEPERSHVAHSVPGGSGIYEEPDVVVQTHRGEVHAAPIGFGEDAVADGMSYAQKEAAAHAARERHLESQSKQRERDAYDRQQALEHEWQDYEAGKDGRHSNQGRPIIPPLKSARGPELSNGYAGRHDPGEEHVYAEVERGVHAAAPEMEGGVQTAKQRRSPPHYGKHSRVGPAPDQPMAMHIGPTKSTHHTSQDVNGADVPTQPIIQHPPQYLPFGYTPMMSGGQTPGQPEMPYKIFMVAPANTGQPMMMPYPYYMPQTMPMAPPMMMAQMYDPRFMPPQGMTVQPPNYQQQPTHTHSTLGRLDSEEDVLPTMQETVHSAPTIQLHSAPPPGNHLKQTDKQYKELDQDALRALEEFQRIHDSAPKHGQISYASSISEEALEETRENVVESAIDMEEMLQKLEEMYAPTPQKQTTIDMLELEKLVASAQSQNESVDPVVRGDPSDVEEVMEQTHEEQIESAIDIDAMLQKLEEMDAEKGHTVGHDVGSGDEKKKKKKSSYEEDDNSEGGKKKKKKKKKKEGSDDFDSDMESESKKKKKKKKNSKKGDEGEESEDEKAKKKKKKKKGSEEDDDFNSEGESDSKKKKKSKNQKDGKKKKEKNKKEHGEEVIAAANVAVVESGVDMDAFLGSDKNTRNSEEPFHIQLHGKPNASERAMAAKLEGLERRVHFVEDSVHIESDDELISTSRSQKNEHAPAPFYEGEEDSVAMDIVQRTESAPVEHPPPSFVNSWNEPARHDLTSDDDDIIIPVKTQHRVRPAVKPRVRIQKNVEVEAYVKPERSAMIETTPSGHSELQLDDVDGFEGDEVITVQRTAQVESAPDIFAMTAPSAGVPEIVVSEVDSLDDQDVITVERTQQIESSPFDEEITQNIITETEAAPIVFEMHERRGLDLHKEDKRKSKMVEGEEEVVVMESVSAVETVPFVLDEKKKSKKDEDKHDKKKKKTKDSDDDDRYKHSNSKDDKKKKKKSEKSDVDEESGDGKTKKTDKKKKKKDSEENSEVDSGAEDEKKKKKKKDKVEEDFGKEKASKKKKKKGSDEEGESDSAEDVKKKKKSKSKWENGDEDSGDEKVKKKKKKKDSADEDDSEGDGKKKPKNDKDNKKKKDKKGKEEAIAALSLHSEVNQESKMADGVDDVIVMETAPAIEAAPIALEAALNHEDEKAKKTKKAKKEKKEKTKKKKKKGGEVEDEGFGMLAPLNARFAPRPLDGGTSPEPKETSPIEAKMEESAIDEVVTVETANVVEATLDAQLEIDAPVATEADLAPVTYLEPQNPKQGQETPRANSALYGVIPASALVKESSQHEDFITEEIDVPTNVSLVETSRDISDLLPSAGDSGNQKLEPEMKMATSATLKSGYVDDVMDVRKEPMVESSPPMAERSVGIFDLKSAAENEPGLGKTDVPEATSTVVEEVLQIERAPQVESSVDIFDLNRDEIGGTSIDVNEKEATKDVVEDALVVESVPQVHRSVDMFDDDIGKPPIGRNTKESMATTKLDKNVDILIIGDHDEKDLILADTSKIPEKAKIEVISDVVPVTSEMGTRDGADDTIKLRGGHVGFSTKEESLLLKDRQSPPQEIGKLESALPGRDLDNDSLDDFFGNSDVTQLLGGDESAEKGKEKATSDPLLPPPRFGATRTQHSTHVSNGDANNNMAAQQTVSPPRGDQLNDSMNNFLASDRQASKRDSLDDGGFWDKHETTPRRLGRRNRPVAIMEHPHRDENANKAPSVDIAKHDSANNLKPKALPNASEDNDSVDGVVMWEGDKVDLLQTMKRPKDSDFNTTAFVSRNVSDGVTTVTPFKLDSDSEEDILSPMMRKNKKTFITQSKS